MKIPELRTDPMIADWLKAIKAKKTTQKSYLLGIQDYTEFTGKTPDELIEEAEEDIDNRVRARKQRVRKYLLEFRVHLESRENRSREGKHLAPMTVDNRIKAVHSFYKNYDIPIPEMQRKEHATVTLEEHKGIPETEAIRKILKLADPVEKAVILVGCSSGLSVNEITNLKISDFKKGYDPEDKVTTLCLRRMKTNYDFVTCLTPEATSAVLDYLDYRNREPSDLRSQKQRKLQLSKQKIYSDDGFLFVPKHIGNEYLIDMNEKRRQLPDYIVQDWYRRLRADTGLAPGDKGVWGLVRSHNARKRFSNKLREAKCDPDLREFMMGHKIEGSKASYFVANSVEVKEEYKRCMSLLMIADELDPEKNPDYMELKQKHGALTGLFITTASESRGTRERVDELSDTVTQQRRMIDDQQKTIDDMREAAALNLEILRNIGINFESPMDKNEIEKVRKMVKDKVDGDKNG